MVKGKLSPRNGSSLEAVEAQPYKAAMFFFEVPCNYYDVLHHLTSNVNCFVTLKLSKTYLTHTLNVTRIIKFYTNLISSFLPPIMVIIF